MKTETIEEINPTLMNAVLKKKRSRIVFFGVLIFGVCLGIYFGYTALFPKNAGEFLTQSQISRLVETVGKLIVLPTNETPTVATVTDLDKLKDQPFFARAQKGDKVLIYVQAGKAVLYNPTLNKIVDVSPLAPTQTPEVRTQK